MKKIIFLLFMMFSISNISQALIIDAKTKEGVAYQVEILFSSPEDDTLYFQKKRFGIQFEKQEGKYENIITDMKVKHNENEYKVPLSAYCDLGSISERDIDFDSIKNGFILILKGTEIKESYETKYIVKYFFKDGILERREVGYEEDFEFNWQTIYYSSDEEI